MRTPEAIYRRLHERYGPQGWWPLYRRRGTSGFDGRGYRTGPSVVAPEDPEDQFEIAVGTVLTQNTNWRNAERALHALQEAGVDTVDRMLRLPADRLESLIRSSGYFRQKAERLRRLLPLLFPGDGSRISLPERDFLLTINGVGPETADSLLLYVYGRPSFIADLYTRRFTARLEGTEEREGYETVRRFYEERLPVDPQLYAEFHALIVEHGKRHCAARPLCEGCPCLDVCAYGEAGHG